MKVAIGQMLWVHQPEAALSQNAPGSGVLYEVLAATPNVRIIAMAIRCTWTVQPNPLELHVTIDGETITLSYPNPVSNTIYYAYITGYVGGVDVWDLTAGAVWKAFIAEGKNVRVQAEITGGTVSNLSARVIYARKV